MPELGLSAAEVAEREARGQVNRLARTASRSTADIVKANIFTRYNLILSVLLVIILLVAPIQDGLFGLVMIFNAAIGIVQELKAKRTLDRLRLIQAPTASVLREGRLIDIDVQKVVLDDIVEIRSGDQLVVDSVVIESADLEIDESLLTGESDAIPKNVGDTCRSGSFVVAGAGRVRATAVGSDAYAVKLAMEAKKFTMVKSELKTSIDLILAVVGWSLVPIGAILVWSQSDLQGGIQGAARGAIAAMVAMVPQGLVLLTSIAFAVAVVRLGRRQTLVQELPAVEILARVDTVCLDKTGTLTMGSLRHIDNIPLSPDVDQTWEAALGALAWSDPAPNTTMQAIKAGHPDPGWRVQKRVPFSSARGWSGVRFHDRGTWLLGGPETVAPGDQDLHMRAEALAARGHRVLLLANEANGQPAPAALVILGDEIRPDAAATLDYFARQGVDIKVISGDHPSTVASVAAQVGIADPAGAVDGSYLPTDEDELAALVSERTLFGRVSPHSKRHLIRAMQRAGHTVAMTGDGVNDVLALKDADIGIAMGNGSPASRSVAQLVLLNNDFDSLPHVVAEGRRIIANIERVANLFLAKTLYAVLLALATVVTQRAFPFLPRHLTLVGSLTIGIPGFFLALEPSAGRAQTGLLRRVWRFALPTGILAAGSSFLAFGIARAEGVPLEESQALATFVLAAVGLFTLTIISRPLTTARKTLIAAMAALIIVVYITPSLNMFYALPLPRPVIFFAGIGIAALTGSVMWLSLRAIGWVRMAAEIVSDPPRRSELGATVRTQLNRSLHSASGGRFGSPTFGTASPPASKKGSRPPVVDSGGGNKADQMRLPLSSQVEPPTDG